ncbi:sigma 54-interacting transcriptional regulator [Desulfovibrio subterraneus]|uniref:sigma 54-interacting transcriptional regulator n=1 Tax=Desulfovibrio subterraneus TaxID=2718620 RepID=UPI0022B85C73|nr:sigma 54-interacting transcriptional regulator [Desulfovibrio subterraneus]WBF67019.1 sigma 54-interacting transcriptional regulator [Desulfovibrio subterraneus]
MARIFIIDADPAFCESLGAIVAGLGHQAEHTQSLTAALASPSLRNADILFLNTALPDGSGLEALPKLRTLPAKPEVIMTTDAASADGAERAIRNGAWDYVAKQGAVDRMVLPLIRALDYRGRKPVKRGEVRLKRDSIIGGSPGLARCLDIVSEAAASDASTLLYGETGVGKEVFARAIHDNSQRNTGPFVAVDCASLSRTLAGSTLFGHRKGAFTGADKDRDGLVAQAHKGTLFLDEIGELPLAMQKIFLRVLQEHRFRPVGGRAEITSDFRLICATNRNLEEMVSRGTFRSDLLFRMRTVVMHIPPLRERIDDLPELANHYIRRICGKYGMPAKSISTDLHAALREYQWPGNVRELIHTLERAVLAAQDETKLFSRHLPDHVRISIARAAANTQQTEDAPAALRPASGDVPAQADSKPVHAPLPPDAPLIPGASDTPDTFTPPLRPGAFCSISESAEPTDLRDDLTLLPPATPIAGAPAQTPAHQKSATPVRSLPSTPYSEIEDKPQSRQPLRPFFEYRDKAFLSYLIELMDQSNGDITTACSISELSRSYLYDLLKKYGIATPQRKCR